MTVSEMFSSFLDNLKVDNSENISEKYGEITRALNMQFRDTESRVDNSLRVGSYGRYTGIKGISDLDMLYIVPQGKWEDYKDNPSKLLSDTKDAIKDRYPNTPVSVDRLIVSVKYKNFHVEVQPVFERVGEDGIAEYTYPDTYHGGKWKKTKPRHEISAMKEFDNQKNNNLRRLCKMARAWKNKNGVNIGGLVIDTLAYNFLKTTSQYDQKSYQHYGEFSRDFFRYLKDEPKKEYYLALGSNQQVKVKKPFQKKAEEAYENCIRAIESGDDGPAYDKWKKVYGRPFPARVGRKEEALKEAGQWRDTEEHIEDYHPVDIRNYIKIDCDVQRDNRLRSRLREMLCKGQRISSNKRLIFKIIEDDIEQPFDIKWKVLNRGAEAKRRDQVRGQIESSNYNGVMRKESADFRGNHLVECYAIVDGVVVARDSILVPII